MDISPVENPYELGENAELMPPPADEHLPRISPPIDCVTTFDSNVNFIPLNGKYNVNPKLSGPDSYAGMQSTFLPQHSDINENAKVNPSDNVYAEPILNLRGNPRGDGNSPNDSTNEAPGESEYDELNEMDMQPTGDDELKMIANELYHYGELAAGQADPDDARDDELVMEDNELYGKLQQEDNQDLIMEDNELYGKFQTEDNKNV